MKKVSLNAVAIAVGALVASSAFATGSITVTAPKYAVEALTSATPVTLPTVTYTMGVGRPIGNGFTFILNPSSNATFSGTCPIPTYTGASTVSVTVKRAGTGECAYDVQVAAAAVAVGDTFAFAGIGLGSHPLATVNSSVSLSITLKDPGETAFIDQNGAKTAAVATSVQAINIYGVQDTNTVADVNAAGGPLTGFVPQGAGGIAAGQDTATVASALLTFDNNSQLAVGADGATVFDWTGAGGGTTSITLTGSMSGLKANKLCIDLNNNGTACETGEVFTVTGSTGTLTGIAKTVFPAVGSTGTRGVSFQADGTTQLGTSRSFAVAATMTPAVGAAESNVNVSSPASNNAAWWVWSANASQLMSPYFSTNPQYVTRFSILNTGSLPVGYTTTCYTEGGVAAAAGASGTLAAAGTTVIDATSVCTFTNPPRGAILFTINAPIGSVKGTYNIVDKVTGANGFVPLTRPYNTNTTE